MHPGISTMTTWFFPWKVADSTFFVLHAFCYFESNFHEENFHEETNYKFPSNAF